MKQINFLYIQISLILNCLQANQGQARLRVIYSYLESAMLPHWFVVYDAINFAVHTSGSVRLFCACKKNSSKNFYVLNKTKIRIKND